MTYKDLFQPKLFYDPVLIHSISTCVFPYQKRCIEFSQYSIHKYNWVISFYGKLHTVLYSSPAKIGSPG